MSSSAVDRVDYDAEACVLRVRYKHGDRYSYFGVPRDAYRALLESESIGAFLNRHIKPLYPFALEGRHFGPH